MAQSTFGTVSVASPLLPGCTCPPAEPLPGESDGLFSFDIARNTLSLGPLVAVSLGVTPGQLKVFLNSLFFGPSAPSPVSDEACGTPGVSRMPDHAEKAALAQCREILLPLVKKFAQGDHENVAVRGGIAIPLESGEVLHLEMQASIARGEAPSRNTSRKGKADHPLLLASLRRVPEASSREKALRARIAILERDLSLRDTLLNEVQHRVKNDLTLVRSFLSLQASEAPQKEVRQVLEEAVNRVGTLARVYDRISGSNGRAVIELGSMLRDLVHDIATSHGDAGDNIACSFPEKPLLLPSRIAVSLGIIVNELVTNAYKYGRCDNSKKPVDVAVHLGSTGPGRIVVAVCDSGGCIPEEIPSGEGFGLGLRLVHALAERHDGAVTISRNGESRIEVALQIASDQD
ncbi:sensor histidine kinase [Alkalispirochaeta americana]|nr:sensor histidine kinase [Alkalispirochaeta americana]